MKRWLTKQSTLFFSFFFSLVFACFFISPVCSKESAALKNQNANKAGLWFDIAPLIELTDRPSLTTTDNVSADDLAWYYSRPSFITMGFQLHTGPLFAAMSIELQQDVGELFLGGSLTNLLVTHDWSEPCFSNNYPSVGFIEGRDQGWFFSLGRRAINMGPGEYSLTLSSQNPWYDHFLGELSAPLDPGSLTYDFLAVNVQNRSNNGKYLFMHRIQAQFPIFSIGISEYNLVTRSPLDFQDIGPFLVYHHLFASGSNVMIQLDAQVMLLDHVRLYAEGLMDDFQLSTEGTSSNPNAFGFHAGLEWAIQPNSEDPYHRPRFFRKDYTTRIGASALEGALVASLEWYWASTYLYRRISSASNQAYFTRYFLQSQYFGTRIIEPWFAYPLGPDRMMFSGGLRYEKGKVAASLRGSFFILGAESEVQTYAKPYAKDWMGPQSPVTYNAQAKIALEYLASPSTLLWSCFSIEGAIENTAILNFSLGLVWRLGLGSLE